MKRALLALVLVGIAADAQAITRYNSTSMSCAKVQATIRHDGAAIMRYMSKRNPGLPLYGRYVSSRRFCDIDEYADSVIIRAADTDRCPVLECKHVDFDETIFWRRRH